MEAWRVCGAGKCTTGSEEKGKEPSESADGGGGGGSRRPRVELFGKQCVRISMTVQKHAFI